MRQNLFGELVLEPIDYGKEIVNQFEQQYGIKFEPDLNKITGFHYWNDGSFPTNNGPTIYCVYKDDEPIYVGSTKRKGGLRSRIGRFCCELMGKTEKTGNHPGAKKYKKRYGNDYSGLIVKYVPMQSLHIITLEEVEQEVIRLLNPMFNIEIYRKYWIGEARLRIA
jgi:hypothetical protein